MQIITNWIKHQITRCEYRGMLKELEKAGRRLVSLKDTYDNLPEPTKPLQKHAKEMVVKEYAQVRSKYREYTALLIDLGLYDDLYKTHMKLFNVEYTPMLEPEE